MLKEPCPYH
jgi:hypothetical protein